MWRKAEIGRCAGVCLAWRVHGQTACPHFLDGFSASSAKICSARAVRDGDSIPTPPVHSIFKQVFGCKAKTCWQQRSRRLNARLLERRAATSDKPDAAARDVIYVTSSL
jgi:hypothetical protein